jgi:hypothetical protein
MHDDAIWKDIHVRVVDQRIGQGVGGFDTIMRVEHIPSRIVVEIPTRFGNLGGHCVRETAVDMIRWALLQGGKVGQ